MSRRKDPVDELAGQVGCLVIGLLWAAVVGLLALIFKASHVSPEEKLRKLQPGYAWQWQIEARDCFQCGAVNERYVRHCYRCGAEIAPPPETSSAAAPPVTGNELWLILGGILFVILLVSLIAATYGR